MLINTLMNRSSFKAVWVSKGPDVLLPFEEQTFLNIQSVR